MSRIRINRAGFAAAALLIILVSFLLRIYSPESDLPPDVSISGSIYTDEGNQCHNSRSAVLYGNWYPDNWKITNYNPVVPYFKFLIFKVFGVGLVQVRAVSFFFALLSLIFFFLTLRSYFSRWLALAGISLLGFNFLFLMYNRIGTFETPMIFWMILTLYFLEKFRVSGKYIFPVMSGAAAFMAFVFKMTGAHIIPVPILSVILIMIFYREPDNPGEKNLVKALGFMAGAIVLSFAVWMILFYLPNREWIKSAPGSYIGNQMFPKSFDQLLGNVLSYNWKEQFFRMWAVWTLALLYIPVFFRKLVMKVSDITEAGFVLFLLSHTAALMIMNHRPTRYLIAAIPPMVFLTVLFLRYLLKGRGFSNSPGTVKRIVFLLFDTVWMAFSLYYCFLPLLSRAGWNIIPVRFSMRLLVLAVGAVLAQRFVLWFLRVLRGGDRKPFRIFAVSFSILLIFLSLYSDLRYYFLWQRDRTGYVRDISAELKEKISDGYIAGLTAPVAVLNNKHRSLFLYPEFVHWEEDTLNAFGITHGLLASFNFEITNFFDQWPEKMEKAKLLNVYNVKEQFLHLYSLTDPVMTGAERKGPERVEITIENPGKGMTLRLGLIEFFKRRDHVEDNAGPFKIIDRPIKFDILPGLNKIMIEDKYNGNQKLFFIADDKWGNVFRYEGEKFPRKKGKVMREPAASGGHTRFFSLKNDGPGYMACSNSGRFIPYSGGFMEARFILKFGNIRSRIQPLVTIDIFENTGKVSVSSADVKKKDIPGPGYSAFPVRYSFEGVKDLEFRVFAKGTSDVSFDYLELVYYQGKFIDGN